MYRTRTLHLALLALALLLNPASAAAQSSSEERDMAEVSAYRLTDSSLVRFTQALRAVAALPESELRALQARQGEALTTLDAAVDAYRQQPAAAAAVTGSGLSIREFFLFTFALNQAAAISQAPAEVADQLPAGAWRENLAFYRQHEADFQRLGEELRTLAQRGRPAP